MRRLLTIQKSSSLQATHGNLVAGASRPGVCGARCPAYATMRHCFRNNSHSGFTLVELLIATLISILVLFATAVPFVAQGNFWANGTSQVEAQRDAQLALSAIAQNARQKVSYTITPTAPGNGILVLTEACGSVTYQGGPAFGGRLESQVTGTCPPPAVNLTLIDGVRSRVTKFAPIPVAIGDYKLVVIQIAVTHKNRSSESLQTVIHLRNAVNDPI